MVTMLVRYSAVSSFLIYNLLFMLLHYSSLQVDVGDGNFVHLRVYQTLPHAGSTLELSAIKTGMKEDDALQYF